MNRNFKPLALAAAVASTGYMAGASAQDIPTNGLGDMAIIPYYTVEGDFQTGIHIINTSEYTQVVKLRFRRASDSMDALDLNLVMSPKDVWTGSLSDDTGTMKLVTDDTTCTVPENSAGQPPGTFEFPGLYREGAEEGYVEVIAMGEPASQTSSDPDLQGQTDEDTAIAEAAEHVNGVPRSCDAVRDNFFSRNAALFAATMPDFIGNVDYETTNMEWWDDLDDVDDPDVDPSEVEVSYRDSDNVLRVSWFLRDAATGLEMGDEAVHVEDFLDAPAMTNQQYGLFSGDITGFDYPDLNGGVPDGLVSPTASEGSNRARFQVLRSILGVDSVLNDWSTASERNVSTDWVVTFPGQYTMLDYYLYTVGEVQGLFGCGDSEKPFDEDNPVPECDFRDLPVRADLNNTFDREEGQLDPEEGELVVSPSIPGQVAATILPNEVNIIEWTNGENVPVLGSNYTISIDTSAYAEPFGWAQLSVSSNNTTSDPDRPDSAAAPAICDWDGANEFEDDLLGFDPGGVFLMNCVSASGGIPMVGFVAWERSFPSDPSANYGRIIPHASTAPVPAP